MAASEGDPLQDVDKSGASGTSGAADAQALVNAETFLRRLEWTVIRRLDGLLKGDHRTFMRGSGMDLADLREYQHHDDVRHIDWNVTARMALPHVRVFTEDREMAAWFLLDLSPSVDFGSGMQRKRQISAELVGVLGRLLTRHGNRVGALLYGTGVDTVIPARSGRSHVLHLLHAMVSRQAYGQAADRIKPTSSRIQSGVTQLDDLLRAGAHTIKRRSTIFVVSDFISEPGWEKPLAQLAMRHEVVAVRLLDPLELELPDLGLLTLRDAETGEQLIVDTHHAGFRKRFAAIAAQREADLRASLAAAGVDTLELLTEESVADAVMRFADLRKQRARLASGATTPKHLSVNRGSRRATRSATGVQATVG